MANFAVVLDPDPARRTGFTRRVASAVAWMDDLIRGSLDSGNLSAVWAAAPSAPVSAFRGSGCAALLFGHALRAGDGQRLDARALFADWTRDGSESEPGLSGFHAGLVFREPDHLVAGCDPMGLFPIYHWSGPDGITLVASSPALIRAHPSFTPRRCLEGLAGVLLTGGPVGGRTLWEGVRRLAPGRVLIQQGRAGLREASQATPTLRECLRPRTIEEAAVRFDDALRRAVERHVDPRDPPLLLLSGGRDSRLLAGALHRQGLPFRTLTLGERSDYEVLCADRVVRALRVPTRVEDVPLERFAELAELHVRAEAVMGNFAGLYTWGIRELLGPGTRAVLTGHGLGIGCGAIDLEWTGASERGASSEETFWESVARHALSVAQLRALVRDPHIMEAVCETEMEMRERFHGYGDDLEARARGFLMEHWIRYHAGAVLWRLSFGSWPSAPWLDRDLMQVSALVAPCNRRPRELQDALLVRHYPALARLPLVRSSGSLEPLAPDLRWRLGRLAGRAATRFGRPRGDPVAEARARTRFRRLYDLDNVGWLGVRRRAEPFRERLHELFDPDALRVMLPPPDRALALERPIAEGFGRKTLLGLMLAAAHD